MKTRFKSFLLAATIIVFLGFITAAPANVWFMITSTGYIIPAESTIFSFEPTLMNDSTENAWIYGMDNARYYYRPDADEDYLMLLKSDAIECSGFNEHNFETWCAQHVKSSLSDYNPTVGKGSIGF
jgi:hypothetical protein